MKKLLFVYNPTSGAGTIVKKIPQIIKIFSNANYQTDLYPTKAKFDGKDKVIADYKEYDRIVVAGGDGMLNELVNAIMSIDADIEVGYIPTGTTNDFAHTHKISKKILKSAKIAVSDNLQKLDVGQFDDTYFSYVAATGFGTKASYATDQKTKKRWKFLAYIAYALKDLNKKSLTAMCRKMTIVADNEIIEGEFIFAGISNSLSIAGMKNLTDKHASLTDGMLEGLFIPLPKGIKEWNQLVQAFLNRNYEGSPLLKFIKAQNFEITCDPTDWTLDGEHGSSHEKVVIKAIPQALNIALPRRKAKKIKKAIKKREKQNRKLQ